MNELLSIMSDDFSYESSWTNKWTKVWLTRDQFCLLMWLCNNDSIDEECSKRNMQGNIQGNMQGNMQSSWTNTRRCLTYIYVDRAARHSFANSWLGVQWKQSRLRVERRCVGLPHWPISKPIIYAQFLVKCLLLRHGARFIHNLSLYKTYRAVQFTK